jgi:hypothetical protein
MEKIKFKESPMVSREDPPWIPWEIVTKPENNSQ